MISGPAPMTAEEHLLLNEVIETHFGLSFTAAKKEFLESRLRPRLQSLHLSRFIDYYLLLQYDLGGEVEHLTRAITNNETYFFRETYQFEGLFADGVDMLRDSPGYTSRLRILCAGCSSGEEPLTLNIFAREAEGRDRTLNWLIEGFDIDSARLATARQAVYGTSSLRSVDPDQRSRYFDALEDSRYQVKAEYRQGVQFRHGNILEPETYQVTGGRYDVVFCRNVLIYFSESAFHQAIRNFSSALRPGGLLFLGHSESLIGRSTSFDTVRLEHCIAYRKVRE